MRLKTTEADLRRMMKLAVRCMKHHKEGRLTGTRPPRQGPHEYYNHLHDALEAHRLRRGLEALQAREREVGYPMMISMDTIDRILDGAS